MYSAILARVVDRGCCGRSTCACRSRWTCIRDRASLAREVEGGWIENVYRLQIMNTPGDAAPVPDRRERACRAIGVAIASSRRSRFRRHHRQVPLRVQVDPGAAAKGSHRIEFEVSAVDDDDIVVREQVGLPGARNMSPDCRRSAAWYREPWPWMLMRGPAAAVVLGIVTVWLAAAHRRRTRRRRLLQAGPGDQPGARPRGARGGARRSRRRSSFNPQGDRVRVLLSEGRGAGGPADAAARPSDAGRAGSDGGARGGRRAAS